jgi:hypothetical protein
MERRCYGSKKRLHKLRDDGIRRGHFPAINGFHYGPERNKPINALSVDPDGHIDNEIILSGIQAPPRHVRCKPCIICVHY